VSATSAATGRPPSPRRGTRAGARRAPQSRWRRRPGSPRGRRRGRAQTDDVRDGTQADAGQLRRGGGGEDEAEQLLGDDGDDLGAARGEEAGTVSSWRLPRPRRLRPCTSATLQPRDSSAIRVDDSVAGGGSWGGLLLVD
jgi:hypothetical protein